MEVTVCSMLSNTALAKVKIHSRVTLRLQFSVVLTACPRGTFGRNCESQCTCNAENTASCDHVTGRCNCRPGWQGVTCTDDVDECQSSPCGDHAACNNTVGSYRCACDTGYTKNTDGICKGNYSNCTGTLKVSVFVPVTPGTPCGSSQQWYLL